MHYIRFLKSPRLVQAPNGEAKLNAKITITTDLGEAFLLENIGVVVCVEDGNGRNALWTGKGVECLWRGRDGVRGLEVVVPLPRGYKGDVRMYIRPKEKTYSVERFEDILLGNKEGQEGGVMAVRSMLIHKTGKATGMAERVLEGDLRVDEERIKVHIWEETGESIARHIWDAGLVLSAYLAHLSNPEPYDPSISVPDLPALSSLLQDSSQQLNILELGSGCGIAGLTLSQFHNEAINNITLTDLEEATEILTHNISLLPPPKFETQKISHLILDWSLPLPPSIKSTSFNLVLIADCTYNPDVVPDLVSTLRKIREMNKDVLVCLAMKVRHESEMVFFDLMRESGWEIREKESLRLPVLGGEEERIEVFVFGEREEGRVLDGD